jgi:hypothetical protein
MAESASAGYSTVWILLRCSFQQQMFLIWEHSDSVAVWIEYVNFW